MTSDFPLWTSRASKIHQEEWVVVDRKVGRQSKYLPPLKPDRLYSLEENLDHVPPIPDFSQFTDEELFGALDYRPHNNFWIEGRNMGYLVSPVNLVKDDNLVDIDNDECFSLTAFMGGEDVRNAVTIFIVIPNRFRGLLYAEKGYGKWLNYKTHSVHCRHLCDGKALASHTNVKTLTRLCRSNLEAVLLMMAILASQSSPTMAVKSPLSKDPVYTPYKGDTETTRRLWIRHAEYASSNAEQRQVIRSRHREHEVRGHWRTYKSGRRVWVSPHRRGDASIGKVITHMKVASK